MSQGATDPTMLMYGDWEPVAGRDSRFTNAGVKRRTATSLAVEAQPETRNKIGLPFPPRRGRKGAGGIGGGDLAPENRIPC